MGWVYRWSQGFLRTCFLPYWMARLEGAEHLSAQGGVILAGNHPTILDGLVLGTLSPRPIRFLVYGEAMRFPLVGAWLRALGFIPVGRGGQALEEARECLHRGDCVGIFPEAVPTHGYELQEFRRGVAVLAQSAQAPVVPFAVLGTAALCPADARIVRGGAVKVRLGEALRPVPGEDVAALRDRVRQAVDHLLENTELPEPVRGWRYLLSACLWVPLSYVLLLLADALGFAGRR